MMPFEPYLFFNGRCDEAIAFYQQALGAQVQMLMRLRESPEPPPPGSLPPGWEDKVMHAGLLVGDALLMCSDGNLTTPARFEGFFLSRAWPDAATARRVFDALASGGEVVMPLGPTFWSPCFGMVKDRFGVPWMVTVPA